MRRKTLLIFCCIIVLNFKSFSEDGYDLWLRYVKVSNYSLLQTYQKQIQNPTVLDNSPTISALKKELTKGLNGLLATSTVINSSFDKSTTLLIGTISALKKNISINENEISSNINEEGYYIFTNTIQNKKIICITAKTDIGILYGTFHFLRLLQTQQSITNLKISSSPKLKLRMLNHWDNLNRSVERGYSGQSIWDWHKLPNYIDQRYIDYARANASIGINAISLTNVNANATVLTKPYLEKVKALADVLRPYGIKVFLTARFSAPIEIGNLSTADPLNVTVQDWWNNKAKEIYNLIPDFGGFLVKANSEGQPGPQNYNRTHADGANMLSNAVAPFNGIIIWRAFVYSNENPEDRHKQAYNEFVPLDGKFNKNILIQVKNGAIDFMPREPFHPLFGAMPKTPLIVEFQITQEYLGQATTLVFLAPLFKECLQSDTYYRGKGSYVANIIDGSLDRHELNGMAGVANIGSDINWCGHPFAQANWYALGRLAWDYDLTSNTIAEEWTKMTFTNDETFVKQTTKLMLESREIVVSYMNPLGLHHIMGTGHHYGPAPWVSNLNRPEWNPVYYHKADSIGIGFNRTITGTKALLQYTPQVQKQFENINTCDEKYLLWFHHAPWNFKMKNGNSLWNELCKKYYNGADSVHWMKNVWQLQKNKIDQQRFNQVKMLLNIQLDEAIWWRNACLLYFQTFSNLPIPAQYEQPNQTLQYYKQLQFPFAPGNGQ